LLISLFGFTALEARVFDQPTSSIVKLALRRPFQSSAPSPIIVPSGAC
jgi:hypothetical protein